MFEKAGWPNPGEESPQPSQLACSLHFSRCGARSAPAPHPQQAGSAHARQRKEIRAQPLIQKLKAAPLVTGLLSRACNRLVASKTHTQRMTTTHHNSEHPQTIPACHENNAIRGERAATGQMCSRTQDNPPARQRHVLTPDAAAVPPPKPLSLSRVFSASDEGRTIPAPEQHEEIPA